MFLMFVRIYYVNFQVEIIKMILTAFIAVSILYSDVQANVQCPTNLTACNCLKESVGKLYIMCDGSNTNFTNDVIAMTKMKLSIDKLYLRRMVNSELPAGVVDLKVTDLAIAESPLLRKIDGIVDFEDLRSIALVEIGIERVPSRLWRLTTLQYILIDNTMISSIKAGEFGNLAIYKLHIHNNKMLTTLEDDAFAALAQMTELGLRNNSLRTLSSRSLPSGNTLESIDLR